MINQKNIADLITKLLQEIHEDPNRAGLKETPQRVAKMCTELFSTLDENGSEFTDFKTFPTTTDGSIVTVDAIPFYSICEHHLMPFFGEVSIGYIPTNNQTLGLSKFARLVDYLSHKPSIQEELTATIAGQLAKNVPNDGVAVFIKARHLCMEMRGAKVHHPVTKTQYFLGNFKNNYNLRQEFQRSIGN